AGFIVVLCGLLAVSEAVEQSAFATTMVPLAALGFAFSFACRTWGITSVLLQFAPTAIVAFVLLGVVNAQSSANMGFSEQLQTQQAATFLSCLVVLLSWTLIRDSVVVFCCVPALVTISLASSIT